MKRPTYKVAVESEGEQLATTTAHAWNSGLDKGRALLRDFARRTGEGFTVHNADTVRDADKGIIQPWHGDKTGRIVYIVLERVETPEPTTPSVLDYDTMTGIYDPAPRH